MSPGAKWVGWEYSLRAVTVFAQGAYQEALALLTRALDLLRAEGFAEFTVPVACGLAACHRQLGQPAVAAQYLADATHLARIQGPGTRAGLLAETAEQAWTRADRQAATRAWASLALSPLPLWSALGELRLIEVGAGDAAMAQRADGKFESIHCQWGTVRLARALDEAAPVTAHGLGPGPVFQPRSRWMFY